MQLNRIIILLAVVGGFALSASFASSQEEASKATTQPIFRVPRTVTSAIVNPTQQEAEEKGSQAGERIAELPSLPTSTPHPLDRALEIAHNGLEHIHDEIFDYSAIMVKRERVDNRLGEMEYMRIKIRNGRKVGEQNVPFSVYMKFLKPKASAGREVIWVKGQNEGKLIAHESGLLGIKRFYLDPDGWVAMKGNRYPIYDAGIENLVVKLIEKATRDRALGLCEVNYVEGAKINKRSCTMIEVTHPVRKEGLEFHKAKVYIDDEHNIPVRYAAYDWPTTEGGKPQLIEEYTYIKVQLNIGLSDEDFDPNNPAYDYPAN